jgi:uncharacterized protein (TIGR04255 family)
MNTGKKFEMPPVVETALSVQFNSLSGFTAAHAGWFWKEYVEKLSDGPPKDWKQVVEAVRLPDQYEKFGVDDVWVPAALKVTHGVVSPRIQIIREDRERMIQLQDTRFVLNWRKQSAPYPKYETLLPEFRNMLHAFESFCGEVGWGVPAYNQWEVLYVDQIKKGTMWDSAGNLNRIFPALTRPPVSARYVPPSDDETLSADWRFSLEGRRGRLHLQFRQARLPQTNEEVVQLTTTARGPVTETQTWEQGLDFGHEALAESFLAITSPEAQETWKKGS